MALVNPVELAGLRPDTRAALGATLAAWHVEEFGHLYSTEVWNRSIAIGEFAAMNVVGALPGTWVAFDGETVDAASLVGSVSLLVTDDLDGHEHLGPWLASLFVHPRARGRGLGDTLVQRAVTAAREAGFPDVYLFTSGQEAYYLQRGWRTVATADAHGHAAAVMVMGTSPYAARRSVCTRWSTDPDVGGAYSYLRVGASPQVRSTLAGPILPGLWFAGEHTSSAHPATMHGAWFSGLRAAEQVRATGGGDRVLVIGAGISGLVTARTLHDQGWRVTVLEASDHLGGRAAIDTSLGVPLPTGGAWLHGNDGHPLAALVRYENDLWDHLQTFVEGHGRLAHDQAAAAVRHADHVLEHLPLTSPDAAVGTVLATLLAEAAVELGPLGDEAALAAHRYLELYMESLYAAPVDDASAREVLEDYALPGGDHFITSSLQPVFDDLAAPLDLRLGRRIRALTSAADEWVTDDGFVADHVVVTVPVGALRAHRIEFSPELPAEVSDAIQALAAGPVCKLFATYDTTWWPRDNRAIYTVGRRSDDGRDDDGGGELPLAFAADISDLTGVPTLSWFAVGEHARAIERMTEDQRCRLIDDVADRCRLYPVD